MSKLAVFGVGAALLLATAPASAVTTFADFSPASNAPNILYVGADDGSGTLSSVDQLVHFHFLNPDGSISGTTIDAMMNLTATTGAATVVGGSLALLPISNGTLTFTATAPVTWGGHTGTNLLSVDFSGGFLSAILGGSTANYGNSTPPFTVNFTSDFLDFSHVVAKDFSLSFSGASPTFSAPLGSSGRSSRFSGTGTFASEPEPQVPEISTWGMMVLGFGGAGLAMRNGRRRKDLLTA